MQWTNKLSNIYHRFKLLERAHKLESHPNSLCWHGTLLGGKLVGDLGEGRHAVLLLLSLLLLLAGAAAIILHGFIFTDPFFVIIRLRIVLGGYIFFILVLAS